MLLDIGLNVLLGLALGTLGGLFGIGGGLIAIPVLGVLFGLDQQLEALLEVVHNQEAPETGMHRYLQANAGRE